MAAAYVGTPEKLTPSQLFHVRKFIRKNKNDRLIYFGHYIIDTISLTGLFNLDCTNCSKAHYRSCCEQGRPYAPSKKTLQQLNLHAEKIITNHLSIDHQNQFKETGYSERSEETDFYSNITLCGNDCFFFSRGEASYCSIHKYALEQEVELKTLKPQSCMMYPIDMIDIDGRILITALHQDTLPFSRWDEDYFRLFLCANHELRSQALSDSNIKASVPSDVFHADNYLPAFRWGKDLIIDVCGKDTYGKIESLLG